jgi:hypothetical protein
MTLRAVGGVTGGGGGSPQTLVTDITAAGTTLGTATHLTAQQNIVTTTGSGTGVSLPLTPATGLVVMVKNYGANTLLVYPNTSGTAIGQSAAGVAVSVPTLDYMTVTYDGTQWW